MPGAPSITKWDDMNDTHFDMIVLNAAERGLRFSHIQPYGDISARDRLFEKIRKAGYQIDVNQFRISIRW